MDIVCQIKKEADQFLAASNLIKHLEILTKPKIVGSYAFDLMVWRDIDIQLELNSGDDPIQIMGQLTSLFLSDPNVFKLKSSNFYFHQRLGLPKGVYLGLRVICPVSQATWKVDCWMLESSEQKKSDQQFELIQNKLNTDVRKKILEWKLKLMGENTRMPMGGSHAIYQAILFEQLRKETDIQQYLSEKGFEISR